MKKILPFLFISLTWLDTNHAQLTNRGIVLKDGKGKRIALVIGNSAYMYGISRNDAKSMKAKLESLNFKVTLRMDRNHQQMETDITSFISQLKKSDAGLFFYTGHGIQVQLENYLVPIGATINESNKDQGEIDVKDNCIKAQWILDKMEATKAHVNLMVLDACRNELFTRGWGRGANEKGFIPIKATGSLIAYSVAAGQEAIKSQNNKNSLYTQALLELLDEPNISINDMFSLVKGRVEQLTNKQQNPSVQNDISDIFYLNPQKNNPLQDSNGDGLIDKIDECPKQYGEPENEGCPIRYYVPEIRF